MRENKLGEVFVNQDDLNSWCNCTNFPYEKCSSCKYQLGNVTQILGELKLKL